MKIESLTRFIYSISYVRIDPRFGGTLTTYDHKLLDEAVEIVEPYQYFYEFNPQYPFGQALSYTTFEYSPIKIKSRKI